jgi:hypothetical protein
VFTKVQPPVVPSDFVTTALPNIPVGNFAMKIAALMVENSGSDPLFHSVEISTKVVVPKV